MKSQGMHFDRQTFFSKEENSSYYLHKLLEIIQADYIRRFNQKWTIRLSYFENRLFRWIQRHDYGSFQNYLEKLQTSEKDRSEICAVFWQHNTHIQEKAHERRKIRSIISQQDQYLEKIFQLLATIFQNGSLPYKRSMVIHRISRRLQALNQKGFDEYYQLLSTNELEQQHLIRDLGIQYTHFYRNPSMWYLLAAEILPNIELDPKISHFNILSAPCSSGEEVFSMIGLLFQRYPDLYSKSSFYGCDICEAALQKARSGHIPILKSPNFIFGRPSQFRENSMSIHISSDILSKCTFFHHNLLRSITKSHSHFPKFDLVFCRNVLMYFNPTEQINLIKNLNSVLNPKGFLIVGKSELLPKEFLNENIFQIIDANEKIYRKMS